MRGSDGPRADVEQENVRHDQGINNDANNFENRDDNDSENESESEDELPAKEGVRRNPRRALRGINRRYHNEEFVNLSSTERHQYVTETLNLAYLAGLDNDNLETLDNQLLLIRQHMQRETDEYGLVHEWHPLYLATKASADDNPTLKQVYKAMNVVDGKKQCKWNWMHWNK